MTPSLYEAEVKKLLWDLFHEEWMDDSDWNDFLKELESVSGISVESMRKDIQAGVEMGYSVQEQLDLVRSLPIFKR